jgi:hypothetical protein
MVTAIRNWRFTQKYLPLVRNNESINVLNQFYNSKFTFYSFFFNDPVSSELILPILERNCSEARMKITYFQS